MKAKIRHLLLSLIVVFPTSYLWSADDFARISDQVVYPPEDGNHDIENIKSIVVVRVSKVDGEEPVREKMTVKKNPPYVLLSEGTHRLEVAKSKVFSKTEETEFFECSVKAGLIYEIRHTEDRLILEERKK